MVGATHAYIKRCVEAGLASAEQGSAAKWPITAQRAAGLASADPWWIVNPAIPIAW
jgi:hypothetical protein